MNPQVSSQPTVSRILQSNLTHQNSLLKSIQSMSEALNSMSKTFENIKNYKGE